MKVRIRLEATVRDQAKSTMGNYGGGFELDLATTFKRAHDFDDAMSRLEQCIQEGAADYFARHVARQAMREAVIHLVHRKIRWLEEQGLDPRDFIHAHDAQAAYLPEPHAPLQSADLEPVGEDTGEPFEDRRKSVDGGEGDR